MRDLFLLKNALPLRHNARVGILGGSFDPPHLCHQLLAISALSLLPIDELFIIPCGEQRFKAITSDFHHRLAMSEIAFSRFNHVRILDIEDHLPKPSYTIHTLNAIKDIRPDLELTLCIGSDLVDGFSTWHRAAKIIETASIAIFERTGHPLKDDVPKLLQKAHVWPGYALPDITSTSIRTMLKQKTSPLVDHAVLSYIKDHGLYNE